MVERFRERDGDGDSREGTETPFRIPGALPTLPLHDTVLFPYAGVPLVISEPRAISLIDDAMRGDRLLALVGSKNAAQPAGPDDLYRTGTAGRIQQLLRRPDGAVMVAIQGIERVKLWSFLRSEPYLVAEVAAAPIDVDTGDETEALRRNVVNQFGQLVQLAPYLPDELATIALNLPDPRQTAYLVAGSLRLEVARKQEILEANNLRAVLEMLSSILQHELEVSELGRRIQSQAQEQMTKAQREYFLREQLRAIQHELGEESEDAAAVNQLREQVEAAGMPEEPKAEALRELSRLEKLPPASPEHSMIRSYLDVLVSLPWSKTTGHAVDLEEARRILDEDHYDLEKIKDRILEYLAVRKLRDERQVEGEANVRREPILCFVGPPGVGKTSLGHSIARALGRKFLRISLGGIRDEAEIRGHRRTYIGAMPGRIIQGLRRTEARDPVFMLDEVDKLQVGFQGDPAAALLEVLDPEQNRDFRDTYIDVPFDLSSVLFIATANTLDTIPGPLLDRMEIIQLSGYTVEEKVHIAERFLVPKEQRANGLRDTEISFTRAAIERIVEAYTREAGVRGLERQIATVCRKAARELGEGQVQHIAVDEARVNAALGRPYFEPEAAERTARPGVATGLVFTPAGGDIIFIEATAMPAADGRAGGLILTGQLGDVMKESAQAALSYVRSDAGVLGIDERVIEGKEFHIHVPAGAIPKDGPSAGITMATALASLLTGRPVRRDLAMTGEITLRGRVLPIGGVREKVLAARRSGMTTVILPARNERDVVELSPEVRQSMQFVYVDTVDEVLRTALEGSGADRGSPAAGVSQPMAAAGPG